MNPLVSVIIPNFNYSSYLRECIDSVLSQTYSEIEVIVVDDGSGDSSRDIIESYGDRIKAVFQPNRGVSAARNKGVAHSKGAFLAFLDADDKWFPEKIELQIEPLLGDSSVGLVHVGVREMDADGKTLRDCTVGASGDVAQDLLLLRPVILGGGSGFMVRRDVFESVSGFDEALSTSADWDFFVRASAVSKVAFVPEVLVQYRIHSSNMHSNIARMESDMIRGFEKAFATGLHSRRRECYGNLHRVLAGSYFRRGDYRDFLRHAAKSVWMKPSEILYFASYPFRALKRKS